MGASAIALSYNFPSFTIASRVDTFEPTPVIFVVNNDSSLRDALKTLIRDVECHVVAFSSAEEFLAHPRTAAPCCLIVDIGLNGLNGLELQALTAAERREMPVIFFTDCNDIPTAVKAMKAGAIGFFTRPFQHTAVLSAIHEALELSRQTLAREAGKQALRKLYAALSLRERQVMALVSAGLLNKQIGSELGISEITVKAHRGRVMQKMQAISLPDLVRMAAKLGLARSAAPQMHSRNAACTPHLQQPIFDACAVAS